MSFTLLPLRIVSSIDPVTIDEALAIMHVIEMLCSRLQQNTTTQLEGLRPTTSAIPCKRDKSSQIILRVTGSKDEGKLKHHDSVTQESYKQV
jgi:hypothetical protein